MRRPIRPPRSPTPKAGFDVALALIIAVAVMLVNNPSTAEDPPTESPTAGAKETARRLFVEGNDAVGRGDHNAALQAFEAAEELVHTPTTGLAVSRTLAALGRLLEARDKALAVKRLPAQPGEIDDFRLAREQAAAHAEELKSRIPSVRVVLSGVADSDSTEVLLDGVPLSPRVAQVASAVDPGTHTVVVRVADSGEIRETITVTERQHAVVHVAVPEGLLTTPAAKPAPAKPIRAPDPSPSTSTILFPGFLYIGASLAVVGAAMGVVAGVAALDAKAAAEDQCDGDICPALAADDIERARTLSHVSTAGFVTLAVGAALGATSIIIMSTSDEPERAALQISATGDGQIVLFGRFW